MNEQHPALAKLAKLTTLREIFRPGAPTVSVAMFRGRVRQLRGVLNGIQDIGYHVVVHGERGVGKTSLTYVATEVYRASSPTGCVLVRLQCQDGDTFSSVWRRFARDFDEEVTTLGGDVMVALLEVRERVAAMLGGAGELDPDEVGRALKLVASRINAVVVIDEFDRAGGQQDRVQFADLIKNLSDGITPVTLVLVGVADDVGALVVGHQSVGRNIREVGMPRMADEELMSIVLGGYEAYAERTGEQLQCEPDAARMIASLSEGFPYYAHLLAGSAGAQAIDADESKVTTATVMDAMLDAVDDASQAIRSAYSAAITARADARLDETLLACAMVQQDEMGWFAAAALRDPFTQILGAPRSTNQYGHHLKRFSDGPDAVLEARWSGARTVRYRFRDPLMRPFILMKAIQAGQYLPTLPSESSRAEPEA